MAKRRKRGDGGVSLRKDGRWEGRVVVGYDDKGLPVTKNVLAKTKSDCIAKLKALRDSIQAPAPEPNPFPLLCDVPAVTRPSSPVFLPPDINYYKSIGRNSQWAKRLNIAPYICCFLLLHPILTCGIIYADTGRGAKYATASPAQEKR